MAAVHRPGLTGVLVAHFETAAASGNEVRIIGAFRAVAWQVGGSAKISETLEATAGFMEAVARIEAELRLGFRGAAAASLGLIVGSLPRESGPRAEVVACSPR